MKKINISENDWHFKLDESGKPDHPVKKLIKNKWLSATVPGTVHTDLLQNGIIEDPFYADNETHLSWISQSDWIYRTEFEYPSGFEKDKPIELYFEGVDTISEIYLNGNKIGFTRNMFLTYRFDVTRFLKPGKNKLELNFRSPLSYAIEEENKYDKIPVELNSSRVYIRKAQYSFGWDWGPSFPTMGLWRPCFLIQEDIAAIESVDFRTLDINQNEASIEIGIAIKGNPKNLHLELTLTQNDINYLFQEKIDPSNNIVFTNKIYNPKLWYPNGAGEQNLYDLKISLRDQYGSKVDEYCKKVGIRKIELILKEKNENTFHFKINNEKVFIKGFNWIPGDSFLPRVTNKKYEELLLAAKESHANIIRVWGGGIYENDEFYDICDRLGLLVWQDFMFACAAYPEHTEFLENVKSEIKENINRLKHHPSIAIWCGNNENEWIWTQKFKSSYKKMPGYKIYHKIIPDILKEHDPTRPYWPSSPFGFDKDPNSEASGNRHQWQIWSGWKDYEEVRNDESLFVTEFGFQGPADTDTFKSVLPANNRQIHDSLFEFHNKQVEGPERIIKFLSAHLPLVTDWESFIYLAQLNQGFALKTCLEHWRMNSKKNNGTIIWQLNDVWPVSSWAVVDSKLRKKIAYYFVKDTFQPTIAKFNKTGSSLNCVVHSEKLFSGHLKINAFIPSTGKEVFEQTAKIDLSKGQSEIVDVNNFESMNKKDVIYISSLIEGKNNLVHRNYFVNNKWKHIELADDKLKIKITKNNLILSAKSLSLFVDIFSPGFTFGRRGFILLPGEEEKLEINAESNIKLDIDDCRIFSLNRYLRG